MSLASKYGREIRGWNWEAILREAKQNTEANEDGDGLIGRAYLGSLINPSGKYYLPFACSNVNACPQCKGSGVTKKQYACHTCNGTGTRTAQGFMNLDPSNHGFTGPNGETLKPGDSFPCNVCNGTGKHADTCHTCNGMGSLEAYRDEVWREALDEIAQRHGGWIEAGEGDPCDTFFCLSIEVSEDEN